MLVYSEIKQSLCDFFKNNAKNFIFYKNTCCYVGNDMPYITVFTIQPQFNKIRYFEKLDYNLINSSLANGVIEDIWDIFSTCVITNTSSLTKLNSEDELINFVKEILKNFINAKLVAHKRLLLLKMENI